MKAEAPVQNQPVTVTSVSRPNARVSPRPLTRCFAVRRVLDVLFFFLKAGVGLQHRRRASHHEFPKKTLASKKLLKMEKKRQEWILIPKHRSRAAV